MGGRASSTAALSPPALSQRDHAQRQPQPPKKNPPLISFCKSAPPPATPPPYRVGGRTSSFFFLKRKVVKFYYFDCLFLKCSLKVKKKKNSFSSPLLFPPSPFCLNGIPQQTPLLQNTPLESYLDSTHRLNSLVLPMAG